jgi:DNA topoisomerase-1
LAGHQQELDMRMSEPAAAAKRAGLKYVTDSGPGIRRERRGKSFVYRAPTGRPLPKRDVERVRSLAIPPAWERVWICPFANGHLQATGYDVRGRKQYRYHAEWTAHRNTCKFGTLAEFGASLPALRARVERDMRLPGMPREKVAACIVHLMDRTYIRVGNSAYARDNDSYGLTTIRNGHARVRGTHVKFSFKAKSGKRCEVEVESSRAAAIIRKCQELPGQELFCYEDGAGKVHDIGSGDVNQYLAEVCGEPFTAKDFRTWAGTCVAALALVELGPGVGLNKTQEKHREVTALKAAAEALGNTVAVCRKFYVHHLLMGAYTSGRLEACFARAKHSRTRHLSVCERAVLMLLKSRAGARRAA